MCVCFEPSRLAASCLVDAYERVLPSRHRRLHAEPNRWLGTEAVGQRRIEGRER